jgi:hypothetical protein
MTDQAANTRSGGIWDALFALVFGRRSAPAPRPAPAPPPQPQPQAQPQPAPEPDPLPGPTTEAQPPLDETPAPPLDPVTPAAPIEVPVAAATTSEFAQRLVDFCVSEWNSFQQGALKETHEPAVSRIGAYWANVGKPEWNGNTTDQPWSAAFISFAMKEAGDNGRFKKATGHCIYINDAIKRCDEDGAPFHGKRIEQYAPQPGDLICRTREGSDVTFDTAANTPWYTSHTDIVTAITPDQVEMIGGNLSQSVSVRRLPLLPDGRLEPAAAASAGVFAIMKNNL